MEEIRRVKARRGKEKEMREEGSEERKTKGDEERDGHYQRSLILQWKKLPFSALLCLLGHCCLPGLGICCGHKSVCVRTC